MMKSEGGTAYKKQLLSQPVADEWKQIVCESGTMQNAKRLAECYAHTLLPVLLCGEPGTEKDLFAQYMHLVGAAAKGPFVPFDCTGAVIHDCDTTQHAPQDAAHYEVKSLLQAAQRANGGTLYLYNIEKLAPSGQHALLCLMRGRPVCKLGGGGTAVLSVRVIAACNGALLPLLESDRFCPELYYRLKSHTLTIPPLRARAEDLALLLQNTLEDCCQRFGRFLVLTAEARRRLQEYSWPGNLLQLRCFIEHLCLTTNCRKIDDRYVVNLLEELYGGQEQPQRSMEALIIYKSPECAKLSALLDQYKGSRAAVAQALGISKTTLWRRMKKFGICQKYSA